MLFFGNSDNYGEYRLQTDSQTQQISDNFPFSNIYPIPLSNSSLFFGTNDNYSEYLKLRKYDERASQCEKYLLNIHSDIEFLEKAPQEILLLKKNIEQLQDQKQQIIKKRKEKEGEYEKLSDDCNRLRQQLKHLRHSLQMEKDK